MTDETKDFHLSMATSLLALHEASSPSGRFLDRGCWIEIDTGSGVSPVLLAECEEPKYAQRLRGYAIAAPQLAKEVVRLNGVIDDSPLSDDEKTQSVYRTNRRFIKDNAWLEDRVRALELIEQRARSFLNCLDGMGESARKQGIRHDHAHYESHARMLRESLPKDTP